jgi:hypothetical protein
VHLITLNNTHTVGTPSGRGIGLSLRPVPFNTQHSQQRDTHNRGGIRTRNPSKRSAASLHLRRRIHQDRRVSSSKRELPDYVEHIYVISAYLTTVSVTQIIVNGRMNSEIMSSKNCRREWLSPNLWYYPVVCLEGRDGTRKTSGKVAGFWADIITWELWNSKQEC